MNNYTNKQNFPILFDLNLVPYLNILDINKLKISCKLTNKYIIYHKKTVLVQCANIIKKFFIYSHKLFCDSKKYSNDILIKLNKSNKFYKRLKFIYVNLLYMDEYTLEYANSWINNSCEYKKNLIQKYLIINDNKKYTKFDLNKLMYIMDLDDIIYIGW